MVYESIVDEASGGIGFVLVLFPCFIQTHGGYHPSAFGKSKRAGLTWRMVTWSGRSIRQALEVLLERLQYASTSIVFAQCDIHRSSLLR